MMDTGGIVSSTTIYDSPIARQPVPRTNAPESNPQAVSGFVPYRVVVATNLVSWLVVEPLKLKNMVIKFGSFPHFFAG